MSDRALADESRTNQAKRGELQEWLRFIRAESHILREHPSLLFQQAANQPDARSPAQGAAERTARGLQTSAWVRWRSKPAYGSPLLLTIRDKETDLRKCQFSPDGRQILGIYYDPPPQRLWGLKIWDAENGVELRTLEGRSSEICACTYTPDGSRIVSAAWDGTLGIWDAETGLLVRTLTGHLRHEYPDPVMACDVSPDGHLIASGSKSGTIMIWDIEGIEEPRKLTGHGGRVLDCTFGPEGKWLASASDDKTVRIWNLKTGTSRVLAGHESDVLSCTFSPDYRWILSTSFDKTVRGWNPASGAPTHILQGHTDTVWSCAVVPNRPWIVSVGSDCFRVWNLETAEPLQTSPDFANTSAAWCDVSRDGTRLVSTQGLGYVGSDVKVWDIPTLVIDGTLTRHRHTGAVSSCAITPDSRHSVSASEDKTARLWDLADGSPLRTIEGHKREVLTCAVSADGLWLATGSMDETIRLWDLEGTRPMRKLTGHWPGVTSCAWSPDGRMLAFTLNAQHFVKLWDVERRATVRVLEGHTDIVRACAFSPDNRFVASASDDFTLRWWSLDDGETRLVLEGHRSYVRACDVSPDARSVVSASSDKTLKRWDTSTGMLFHTLEGHEAEVTGCAFTRDGRLIVSVSADRTMRIWTVNTGQCISVFPTADRLSCCAAGRVSLTGAPLAFAGDNLGGVYVLELINVGQGLPVVAPLAADGQIVVRSPECAHRMQIEELQRKEVRCVLCGMLMETAPFTISERHRASARWWKFWR